MQSLNGVRRLLDWASATAQAGSPRQVLDELGQFKLKAGANGLAAPTSYKTDAQFRTLDDVLNNTTWARTENGVAVPQRTIIGDKSPVIYTAPMPHTITKQGRGSIDKIPLTTPELAEYGAALAQTQGTTDPNPLLLLHNPKFNKDYAFIGGGTTDAHKLRPRVEYDNPEDIEFLRGVIEEILGDKQLTNVQRRQLASVTDSGISGGFSTTEKGIAVNFPDIYAVLNSIDPKLLELGQADTALYYRNLADARDLSQLSAITNDAFTRNKTVAGQSVPQMAVGRLLPVGEQGEIANWAYEKGKGYYAGPPILHKGKPLAIRLPSSDATFLPRDGSDKVITLSQPKTAWSRPTTVQTGMGSGLTLGDVRPTTGAEPTGVVPQFSIRIPESPAEVTVAVRDGNTVVPVNAARNKDVVFADGTIINTQALSDRAVNEYDLQQFKNERYDERTLGPDEFLRTVGNKQEKVPEQIQAQISGANVQFLDEDIPATELPALQSAIKKGVLDRIRYGVLPMGAGTNRFIDVGDAPLNGKQSRRPATPIVSVAGKPFELRKQLSKSKNKKQFTQNVLVGPDGSRTAINLDFRDGQFGFTYPNDNTFFAFDEGSLDEVDTVLGAGGKLAGRVDGQGVRQSPILNILRAKAPDAMGTVRVPVPYANQLSITDNPLTMKADPTSLAAALNVGEMAVPAIRITDEGGRTRNIAIDEIQQRLGHGALQEAYKVKRFPDLEDPTVVIPALSTWEKNALFGPETSWEDAAKAYLFDPSGKPRSTYAFAADPTSVESKARKYYDTIYKAWNQQRQALLDAGGADIGPLTIGTKTTPEGVSFGYSGTAEPTQLRSFVTPDIWPYRHGSLRDNERLPGRISKVLGGYRGPGIEQTFPGGNIQSLESLLYEINTGSKLDGGYLREDYPVDVARDLGSFERMSLNKVDDNDGGFVWANENPNVVSNKDNAGTRSAGKPFSDKARNFSRALSYLKNSNPGQENRIIRQITAIPDVDKSGRVLRTADEKVNALYQEFNDVFFSPLTQKYFQNLPPEEADSFLRGLADSIEAKVFTAPERLDFARTQGDWQLALRDLDDPTGTTTLEVPLVDQLTRYLQRNEVGYDNWSPHTANSEYESGTKYIWDAPENEALLRQHETGDVIDSLRTVYGGDRVPVDSVRGQIVPRLNPATGEIQVMPGRDIAGEAVAVQPTIDNPYLVNSREDLDIPLVSGFRAAPPRELYSKAPITAARNEAQRQGIEWLRHEQQKIPPATVNGMPLEAVFTPQAVRGSETLQAHRQGNVPAHLAYAPQELEYAVKLAFPGDLAAQERMLFNIANGNIDPSTANFIEGFGKHFPDEMVDVGAPIVEAERIANPGLFPATNYVEPSAVSVDPTTVVVNADGTLNAVDGSGAIIPNVGGYMPEGFQGMGVRNQDSPYFDWGIPQQYEQLPDWMRMEQILAEEMKRKNMRVPSGLNVSLRTAQDVPPKLQGKTLAGPVDSRTVEPKPRLKGATNYGAVFPAKQGEPIPKLSDQMAIIEAEDLASGNVRSKADRLVAAQKRLWRQNYDSVRREYPFDPPVESPFAAQIEELDVTAEALMNDAKAKGDDAAYGVIAKRYYNERNDILTRFHQDEATKRSRKSLDQVRQNIVKDVWNDSDDPKIRQLTEGQASASATQEARRQLAELTKGVKADPSKKVEAVRVDPRINEPDLKNPDLQVTYDPNTNQMVVGQLIPSNKPRVRKKERDVIRKLKRAGITGTRTDFTTDKAGEVIYGTPLALRDPDRLTVEQVIENQVHPEKYMEATPNTQEIMGLQELLYRSRDNEVFGTRTSNDLIQLIGMSNSIHPDDKIAMAEAIQSGIPLDQTGKKLLEQAIMDQLFYVENNALPVPRAPQGVLARLATPGAVSNIPAEEYYPQRRIGLVEEPPVDPNAQWKQDMYEVHGVRPNSSTTEPGFDADGNPLPNDTPLDEDTINEAARQFNLSPQELAIMTGGTVGGLILLNQYFKNQAQKQMEQQYIANQMAMGVQPIMAMR